MNQKIYGKTDEWRERPLVGEFPYVFLDGLWLKRSWGSRDSGPQPGAEVDREERGINFLLWP